MYFLISSFKSGRRIRTVEVCAVQVYDREKYCVNLDLDPDQQMLNINFICGQKKQKKKL